MRFILAGLLALSPTLALADGMIVPPPVPPIQAQYAPRHIYRDGQYFFCPYPEFDPYCMLPNDYSAALHPRPGIGPPEGRPGPPVLVMPGLPPGLAAHANRAIQNALRPRNSAPPELSMEQDRERVISQGEEHCRRWPNDSICHKLK